MIRPYGEGMSSYPTVLLESNGTRIEARCSQCGCILQLLDSPRAALFAAASLQAQLETHACISRDMVAPGAETSAR